jgi:prevent-host-death family protein
VATYSIYQTKARLSEVLRLVKTRREVVITERGKPIAKIVPFAQTDEESLDRRIEYLASTGQLVPATIAPGDALTSPRSRGKRKAQETPGVLQRFLADRNE